MSVFRNLRRLFRGSAPRPTHVEPLSLEAFHTALLSDDLNTRLFATIQAEQLGPRALTVASELLSDHSLPRETRVWALQAIARFLSSHREAVNDAAIGALSDPAPEVRAVALQILDDSRPEAALPAIAALQSDTATNPLWWADDGGTIGTTATELLRAIGTPAALSLLKRQ